MWCNKKIFIEDFGRTPMNMCAWCGWRNLSFSPPFLSMRKSHQVGFGNLFVGFNLPIDGLSLIRMGQLVVVLVWLPQEVSSEMILVGELLVLLGIWPWLQLC